MRSVHSKNTRVRFDGKWAVNLLVVSTAMTVVIAYANFWMLLAGVICCWLFQECCARLRRTALGSSANKILKDVDEPMEQMCSIPRPQLSRALASKASEGAKRTKRKGKCASHTEIQPMTTMQPMIPMPESNGEGEIIQQTDFSTNEWHWRWQEGAIDTNGGQEEEDCTDADDDMATNLAGHVATRDPTDVCAGHVATRDPTDVCEELSARERWSFDREAAPASAPSVPPEHVPQTNAAATAEVKATEKTSSKCGAHAAPPRGAFEREIMKLEKKVREVKKLEERRANGEALEQKQLQKIARGRELQDLIDKLRIQIDVAEFLNKKMLSTAAEVQNAEQVSEARQLPASIAETEVMTEIEFPPGLGIEEPLPPPGLGCPDPPFGLGACDGLCNSLLGMPREILHEGWSTEEWQMWEQLMAHGHLWDATAAYNTTHWGWATPEGLRARWDASACWPPVHEAWNW